MNSRIHVSRISDFKEKRTTSSALIPGPDHPFLTGLFIYHYSEDWRFGENDLNTFRLKLLWRLGEAKKLNKSIALALMPHMNSLLEYSFLIHLSQSQQLGIEAHLIQAITRYLDQTPSHATPGNIYIFKFLSKHIDLTNHWLQNRLKNHGCPWALQILCDLDVDLAFKIFSSESGLRWRSAIWRGSSRAAFYWARSLFYSYVGQSKQIEYIFKIETLQRLRKADSVIKSLENSEGFDAEGLRANLYELTLAPIVEPFIPSRYPSDLPLRALQKRLHLLEQISDHQHAGVLAPRLNKIILSLNGHIKIKSDRLPER